VRNCGVATYQFTNGTSQELWCGSSINKVLTGGPARAELVEGGAYVSIPDGAKVEIEEAANGGYTIDVLEAPTDSSESVTLVNSDASTEIKVDDPVVTAQAWAFTGFSQPLDNGGVINTVKGGQAVPLKWRITEHGAPVTDLASAKVSFPAGCDAGEKSDAIEQTTAGASGLINLGNGNYQLNWKTPRTPGGVSGKMLLDIGDGVFHEAVFQLK
jgi:hypothetical protein